MMSRRASSVDSEQRERERERVRILYRTTSCRVGEVARVKTHVLNYELSCAYDVVVV